MLRLVLLSEGFAGRTYDLKVERTTVGRVADNAFELPEGSVSSHHAELLLRGNEVLVRDLGSTNGTFINGEKVSEAVLKPGQNLRFGTVEMRLESADGAPSTPGKEVPLPKEKKQVLDQTRVIPQGVKLDELEGTKTPLDLDTDKTFSKKSTKGSKIFLAIVMIAAAALVGLLLVIVFRSAPH